MKVEKLKKGDKVRVIAPARSLGIISEDVRKIAIKRFNEMGLEVEYSENAEEMDMFLSSKIESRVEDIHNAFEDESVKAIFTVIGGFNSNQLLNYLNYDLIKRNPKIFCGYSDITAIANAIHAKTGMTTYIGPHFSTIGMKKGIEYTLEYFEKIFMKNEDFEVKPSEVWSDDEWYLNQENRNFEKNEGFKVIQDGEAKGILVGGNLCTFNLLQGTDFMPSIDDKILFFEDTAGVCPEDFDRDLQSVLQQKQLKSVKALLIGRFQKGSNMNLEKLKYIIETKKELKDIPVVYGFDFGHTSPHMTLPLGGEATLKAYKNLVELKILK